MKLNNILIPLIRKEIYLLLHWIHNCPKLCEETSDERKINFHLSIDKEWRSFDKELLSYHINKSNLKHTKLHFHSIGMSANESVYMKNIKNPENVPKLEFGLINGPNKQFFESIYKITQKCSPNTEDLMILLEVDTIIIKQYWVDLINTQLLNKESFWIIGSSEYTNRIHKHNYIKKHINGNAIYSIGNYGFQKYLAFCSEILQMYSKEIESNNLAFDFVTNYFMDNANKSLKKKYKPILDSLTNKVYEIDFIQNISEPLNDIKFFQKNEVINEKTIVIHSKIISSFSDAIHFISEKDLQKYLKYKNPLNRRVSLLDINPITYFIDNDINFFSYDIKQSILNDQKIYLNKFSQTLVDLCLWNKKFTQ